MEEKRKEKRISIKLTLEISNLYKQDNVQVKDLNAPIEVTNISKSGIGFKTESVLPVGYYFSANLDLGNDNVLHSVVQIVRSQAGDDSATIYGCEFIGMAAILSYLFDDLDSRISE